MADSAGTIVPKDDEPAVQPARVNSGSNNKEARNNFPIAGIGASAGGLEAFTQLLSHLPPSIRMGFVLVQHLDPTYKSMLTELLAKATKIPMVEVKDGMLVKPGHAYVIAPNTSMTISSGVLHVTARLEAAPKHTPIDIFLTSLARDRKSASIGVILSGTSVDGIEGLRAIKEEAGITIAQDEASAKYYDLPRSAVNAGVVDMVLSPTDIAKELVRLSQHPYAPYLIERKAELLPQSQLGIIFAILRERTGADFSNYKHATIRRRILKRMIVLRIEKLEQYVDYLRSNASEPEALFQEILIHVTGFFREPEIFSALKTDILPKLMTDRSQSEPIRAWIPGCSTGEEAYSLAIAMSEYFDNVPVKPVIQIFATDINENVLTKAREGIYADVSAISPGRLRRFFTQANGNYQINKTIRNMVIFAKQDVNTDPPFSRMDIILCRNLLIYLGPGLQKRVVPTLHYALKPKGFLLLGNFESVSGFKDLFKAVNSKQSIYEKRSMPTPTPIDFFPTKGEPFERKAVAKPAEPIGQPQATEAEVVKEADRLLLGRYAPASVIVNADMDIVQFRGRSGVFLEPAPGRASLNVLHMAKEGLMMDLHSALTESKKRSIAVRREGISIKSDNRKLSVSLEVTPLQASGLFLVTFEETTLQPPSLTQEKARLSEREKQAGLLNREVARLERELASTKDYLQSIIEDKEAANEELKAANEEIQSSNEELQSTNEELETAKEELQSTNEELTTVNEELQNRNLELGQINDDLNAFLTSINLPVLILGSDLRIRRTTPQADKLLGLAPTDAGRSLADLKLNINAPTLMAHVAEVMDNMSPRDMDITDNQGHWWSKWIRPYRTSDNKIEGVVITFVDIDRLKRVEESLRTYTGNLQQLVDERTAQLEDRARLSTIGETAAMVGHDLRNPLQAMANTLYLANEKAKTMNDQSLASYLDSIGQQAGYMNRIVTDLQDYSKPVAPMFTNVNLGELVGETLSSVTIPDRIKVVRDFEPHLETVEADPNLLRRVFTNIVANALQAMPSGQGRLSISTSRKGEMALITVQDTGEGMSKETLSKLFNPLFTTKARGTGLGLPIAKRLVEAHEGTVNATSEPGKGATFEILLPIKQSRRSPDETRTSGSI